MTFRPRNAISGQFAAFSIEMLESPAYRVLSRSALMVIARVEIVGKGVQGIIERAGFEMRKIPRHRQVRDAADGEANTISSRHGGAGDDGEIAMTARDLAKRAAALVSGK